MEVLFMLLLSILLNVFAAFDWLAIIFGWWTPFVVVPLFVAVPVIVLLRSGGQEDLIITEEAQ